MDALDADKIIGGLVMAGQLGLGLGLLVFIHELGHFLAARAFGIRVEKFYVFFDFGDSKLFSKQIGDTEYGIGWFPLGGYVKISGMIDESMDKEQMDKPPEPWEFRSKPAWQRLIVMLAGIIMNVILGIIIFTFVLSYYSKDYVEPENITHGIYTFELGEKVGLQTGDKILTINGRKPERDKDLSSMAVIFGEEMTVLRGEDELTIPLPDTLFKMFKESGLPLVTVANYPFMVDSVSLVDKKDKPTIAAKLGVKAGDTITQVNNKRIEVYGDLTKALYTLDSVDLLVKVIRDGEEVTLGPIFFTGNKLGFWPTKSDYETTPYTLASAFRFGTKDGFEAIYYNAVGIAKMFTGDINPSESLQSPIGIAFIYGPTWEWSRFWYLTGLISFILAFMNLLPIPALDGGHVVFILIEVVRGKPVSDKIIEYAQVVGMILLLLLMAYAFGNDIYKNWFK